MTLAYLFWHWTEAPREEYEAGLREFHQALRGLGVPGLQGSAAYRITGAPWTAAASAYEDWYLVGGSADLDPLNEAAVSAAMRARHDRPAAQTAGVAGGLYRLQRGDVDLDADSATWLAKPKGVSYDAFYAGLPPLKALFRRQMVLGPTPEFLALGGRGLEGLTIPRERVV